MDFSSSTLLDLWENCFVSSQMFLVHCQSRFLFTGVGLYPAFSNSDWNKKDEHGTQAGWIHCYVNAGRKKLYLFYFSYWGHYGRIDIWGHSRKSFLWNETKQREAEMKDRWGEILWQFAALAAHWNHLGSFKTWCPGPAPKFLCDWSVVMPGPQDDFKSPLDDFYG